MNHHESTEKGEESQPQDELRSEPAEEETIQEPTQVKAISYIQESSHKSEDSQCMDYEFLENLFQTQLREDANARVSS